MLRRHFLNALFDSVSNKIYYKTSNGQPYDFQKTYDLFLLVGFSIIKNPLKSNDFVADNWYCATFVKPLYILGTTGSIGEDEKISVYPLFSGKVNNNNSENITDIKLPNVKIIGNQAFYDCESLTNITIPASVTSIGDYAFEGCSSLTSITFDGAKEQWEKIQLGYAWDHLVPAKVVHCIDGDVEI